MYARPGHRLEPAGACDDDASSVDMETFTGMLGGGRPWSHRADERDQEYLNNGEYAPSEIDTTQPSYNATVRTGWG